MYKYDQQHLLSTIITIITLLSTLFTLKINKLFV